MLLGQDVRGRHESNLIPGPNRRQACRSRHRGLPRPDLALQQAAHRNRTHKVPIDFRSDPRLRPGQRVGQPACEFANRGFWNDERKARVRRLPLMPPAQDPQLDDQELVECKTPDRLGVALPSIWKVRALKGRDKWQQVLLCPYFHGQGIPQRRTGEIKRPADDCPELLVGNALGLRVERHEAPGVQ